MAKWHTAMEQVDLPDGSSIIVSYYTSGGAYARWNVFRHSARDCEIVAYADLDTEAEGWRLSIDAKADDYPAVLAFVRFACSLGDGADAVIEHYAALKGRVA